MKQTFAGVLSATVLAVLPFFTLHSLLYADVAAKYFLLLAWVLILALWSAYLLATKKLIVSTRGKWLVGALILMLLVQYVSALFGAFPERSLWSDVFWATGTLFLTHLALLSVMLGQLLSKKDWSVLRRTIVVTSGICGILTILGVSGFSAINHVLWIPLGKTYLTFGNETYAGAYLLLAFVLGLIEYFNTKKESLWRKITLGSLILTALSPLLINIGLMLGKTPFMSVFSHPMLVLGTARASSAALIALLIFIVGYVLIKRVVPSAITKHIIRVWSGALIVGGMLGIALLFTPGSAVQTAYIESSSAARVILWDASVKAFEARPLLGWGPENFNYAIAQYFDSRLFQEENLGEIWFDRAHNVFLDTLTTTGVVGLFSWALLIALYLRTVRRARKAEVIGEMESVLLYALVPVHLLQMQTGFDTVTSYTVLALMLGYAFFLEQQQPREGKTLAPVTAKAIAVGLVLVSLISAKTMLVDEYVRESALLSTLTARNAESQKTAIATSLARVSSFESLRISYASFLNGALASIAKAPSPQKTTLVLEFIKIYESYFDTYLKVQPDSYRARINYAYLLLIQSVLGENRLTEAKALITDSYALSPGNPLTYILDSATELYSGHPKEADRLMKEALAINPNVEFTQEAAHWLEAQKKSFPNISVLRITNL